MMNRHLKKILLTTTAFFWASCGGDSEATAPTTSGKDQQPEINPEDIDGIKTDTLYGIRPVYSSSSGEISSSDSCESSSSTEFHAIPLYGIEPLYGDTVVTECTPMDSSVAYFAEDYSTDNAKFWKKEEAKHDAVDKIDSIKQTLAETPVCLENLREELDKFVALYGAPTIIQNAVLSCDDGTILPSEEYEKFLTMKEEWEANKPALEKELQKVYEDKLKEIEEQINKCLEK